MASESRFHLGSWFALGQGDVEALGDAIGDFFGEHVVACSRKVDVVDALHFFLVWFDHGMEVVDFDIVFFHHAQGGIAVFVFLLGSDFHLGLELLEHGRFCLATRGSGGSPDEFGAGFFQACDQGIETLFIHRGGAVVLGVFPTVNVPESPIEMNQVPLGGADPVIEVSDAVVGCLGIGDGARDGDFAIEQAFDFLRVAAADRVTDEKDFGSSSAECGGFGGLSGSGEKASDQREGEAEAEEKTFHGRWWVKFSLHASHYSAAPGVVFQ